MELNKIEEIENFGREIYYGKITLTEADEDQSSLLLETMN